jgi:heme A synthase
VVFVLGSTVRPVTQRTVANRRTLRGGKREMQNTKLAGSEGISYARLPGVALLAAIAAALANALVYFAASGMGTISRGLLLPSPMGVSPLTVGLVAITSVMGAIGAAIVFTIIGLFARHPVRLFRIVAAMVLVISFVMPATIPGVPVAMRLSLAVMHVVAWAVSVGLLTTLARQAKPASV